MHSPLSAIAAKFPGQPRRKIADRAAQESTVQKVDLPVGEMGGAASEKVVEIGNISILKETTPKPEKADNHKEKGRFSIL